MTPRVGKKPGETVVPVILSGSPPPVMVLSGEKGRIAATDSRASDPSR